MGMITAESYIHDKNKLTKNVNVVEADITQCKNMAFDSLRFESTAKETDLNNNEN